MLSQQTFALVKTYWRRLQCNTFFVFQDVLKTSWRRFEDLIGRHLANTCWRRLENVLKTSWRLFRKTYCKYVLKTSWKTRNICWNGTSRPIKRELTVYGNFRSCGVNKNAKTFRKQNQKQKRKLKSKWKQKWKFIFIFIFVFCFHFHFCFCFHFHFCFCFCFYFVFCFFYLFIFVRVQNIQQPNLGQSVKLNVQFKYWWLNSNRISKCNPTVSTCALPLILPVHYSNKQVMKEELRDAAGMSKGFNK